MIHWVQTCFEVSAMKKFLCRMLHIWLCLALLMGICPEADAYVPGEAFRKDLSTWIQNPRRREYVEMMLDYHVRNNEQVQNALSSGFAALFFFDGCSDHMDDPQLSDLSYFRVSGVCVALKVDGAGQLQMVYFNDNASTIPDRPLEIGAWNLPEVGDVGPATVYDGTYQIYSVRHKGQYEALHMRTDYLDAKLDAVYMTPEGFVNSRANEINIHTRTSNHTSGRGMWSAGCPLLGDGDSWEFWKMMQAVYYSTYDSFELDNFVGTVTVDRNFLRTEMYTLYRNPDAVDAVLTNTRKIQPEQYLDSCSRETKYDDPISKKAVRKAQVMTLPCSNETDARSLPVAELEEGDKISVLGSIRNSAGNKWYQVEYTGEEGYQRTGYLFSGHLTDLGWFEKLVDKILR